MLSIFYTNCFISASDDTLTFVQVEFDKYFLEIESDKLKRILSIKFASSYHFENILSGKNIAEHNFSLLGFFF